MLLDFLAGNSGVMNVWMCFVLNKVIQNNQILSEGSYTLPFFAFVEISIQGANDNMILIQISWIDNPIRLQEGKAADLHPSSQPSYFHLRRRIALYSSYWPLKWILSTTLFPPHSRLLHHHRKYLYEFYRASRPPLEWWYLSVQRYFLRLWSLPWLWKFSLLVLASISTVAIPMKHWISSPFDKC